MPIKTAKYFPIVTYSQLRFPCVNGKIPLKYTESEYVELENLTLYTGVSRKAWGNVWREAKLSHKLTNMTSDIDFASDYSYDFEAGQYDDVVVEVSNMPISSVIAVRHEGYEDDNDFTSILESSLPEKLEAIKSHELFIIDLHSSKDKIVIKLIEK